MSQAIEGTCMACKRDAANFPRTITHTCEPRELDAILRADEGEPRLELDADERAGVWIVHPGGRMARIDLHARGNFLIVVPQGSAEGSIYAMPTATSGCAGKLAKSCARQPCDDTPQSGKEE